MHMKNIFGRNKREEENSGPFSVTNNTSFRISFKDYYYFRIVELPLVLRLINLQSLDKIIRNAFEYFIIFISLIRGLNQDRVY